VRAVDTNVLVHAEILGSEHHPAARQALQALADGPAPWAIPWPCVYEFLRLVTHPRVFHPPVPMERALADLAAILASPSLVLLAETPRHAEVLASLLRSSGAAGNLVHDAHIAALCLEHGVTELVTGDRDFLRFAPLKVVNPFARAKEP
jgi:toxin-antitoxin system PIN domain toxin